MATKPKRSRRGTPPNPTLARPNYPYTMRLGDGRTLLVEVPGRWVTADRDGTPAFLPDGVHFLDRVRSAFLSVLDRAPSPGFLTTLREALGLTQREFAARVGVDKMTVSRWERGALRPSREALVVIERVRKEALRRGVALEG
jgi:DNA-binding XRE family transcriptional regulator